MSKTRRCELPGLELERKLSGLELARDVSGLELARDVPGLELEPAGRGVWGGRAVGGDLSCVGPAGFLKFMERVLT
jgi:hypothetical protein